MNKAFKTEFNIRWSELDVNRHVANTTYQNLTVETRVRWFRKNGIGQNFYEEKGIGPVILREEFHYLKELHADEKAIVDISCYGRSEDNRFAMFDHKVRNPKGDLCVFSRLLICFVDLELRKIVVPPQEIIDMITEMELNPDFHFLSKEEIRPADIAAMQ